MLIVTLSWGPIWFIVMLYLTVLYCTWDTLPEIREVIFDEDLLRIDELKRKHKKMQYLSDEKYLRIKERNLHKHRELQKLRLKRRCGLSKRKQRLRNMLFAEKSRIDSEIKEIKKSKRQQHDKDELSQPRLQPQQPKQQPASQLQEIPPLPPPQQQQPPQPQQLLSPQPQQILLLPQPLPSHSQQLSQTPQLDQISLSLPQELSPHLGRQTNRNRIRKWIIKRLACCVRSRTLE